MFGVLDDRLQLHCSWTDTSFAAEEGRTCEGLSGHETSDD